MMRAVYTKAIVREPAQEQLHPMADKDLSRGRTPQHVRVKDPGLTQELSPPRWLGRRKQNRASR